MLIHDAQTAEEPRSGVGDTTPARAGQCLLVDRGTVYASFSASGSMPVTRAMTFSIIVRWLRCNSATTCRKSSAVMLSIILSKYALTWSS